MRARCAVLCGLGLNTRHPCGDADPSAVRLIAAGFAWVPDAAHARNVSREIGPSLLIRPWPVDVSDTGLLRFLPHHKGCADLLVRQRGDHPIAMKDDVEAGGGGVMSVMISESLPAPDTGVGKPDCCHLLDHAETYHLVS
jgi:hypothetical protein